MRAKVTVTVKPKLKPSGVEKVQVSKWIKIQMVAKEKETKKANKKLGEAGEAEEAKENVKLGLSDDDLSDDDNDSLSNDQSDDSDQGSSKSLSNKENVKVKGEKKLNDSKIQNQHKFTMMTFLKNKNKGKKPN